MQIISVIFSRSSMVSLRSYIFLCMLIVVLVPVVYLSQQREQQAFERELEKVEQGHLIIARNLSEALSRYASDLTATFDFIIGAGDSVQGSEAARDLLASYDFRYVLSFDSSGRLKNDPITLSAELPSPDLLADLRNEARLNATIITGVKQLYGEPVLFAVRRDAQENLHIGAFDTSYMSDIQKKVAFGERGHAMIVDKNGRVLAHPNPEWQSTSKDASGLEVVQRMISGETGVLQFYAPPMKADVVSGYTSVAGPGWGVMVPQPIEELRLAAKAEASHMMRVLLVLFAVAAMVSWVLSGLISKPLAQLSDTVSRIQSGDMSARVPVPGAIASKEMIGLRDAFNALMDSIGESKAALQKSLKEAELANAYKTKAVTVLSHEMRTPLNGILGANELLSDTELSEMQKRYFAMIQTSSQTLLRHVNDVLDANRPCEPDTQESQTVFNLQNLLSDIIEENSPMLMAKENTVALDLPQGQPLFVKSDIIKIRKIASNLIGNAAKFSDHNTIHVIVSKEEDEDVKICVVDSGIGIRKQDQSKIFEPFAVADASYSRRTEGTGLGLSILASAAQSLGAAFGVESEYGVGSTFWVSFPGILQSDTLQDRPFNHQAMPAIAQKWTKANGPLTIGEPPLLALTAS